MNTEYVEKALSKLEVQLKRDTQMVVKGQSKELDERVVVNTRQIRENEQRVGDRLKELRRTQTDSEERLRAGYLGSEIFE